MKTNLNPITKFLLMFIGGIVLFYAFYYSPIYENYIMPLLLNSQAKLASIVLSILGEKTIVDGDNIIGDRFKVSIKGGCDGMEATALYVIAIVALPIVTFREKRAALFYGLLILFVVNIFRIAMLYYAGLYWPKIFEFMHLHGGVIVFTMFSVILWLIWVNRMLVRRQNLDS